MKAYDANGTEAAAFRYDAYGNILYESGSMAEKVKIRYRGYYYDAETGFYYLQSRYYAPSICRFISSDQYELIPTLSQIPGQLNLYAYCNNNPVMYVDPSGEVSEIAVIFWMIIGVLSITTLSYIETQYHYVGNLINSVAFGIIYLFQCDISLLESSFGYSEGRIRNRGRDSGLWGYTDKELEEMLQEAKKKGNFELAKRIIRELKNRKVRNKRKRRNYNHGWIYILFAESIRRINENANR